MTIPITPGPFSFLAELGKAGGAAFEAHEKDRQTKLKEAQTVLNQMLELRAKEYLPPEAFHSPQAAELYKTLGITPVSDKPTTAETSSGLIQKFLGDRSGAAPGSDSEAELRAALGLPSAATAPKVKADVAKAGADVATATAAVPQAQLAGTTATAQLPGAANTAIADQQSAQDTQFKSIADRVVQDMFNKTKKLPTSADALKAGMLDERAKPFGTAITQAHYGAAIESLRAKLFAEQTARIAANAKETAAEKKGAGQGLKPLPTPILKQVTDQQALVDDIDKAIEALEANPNAVGAIKGHLPGTILSMVDPAGVEARSALQRVRSANLHALYGSRLTQAEIKQTSQMHSNITDPTGKVSIEKLKQMRERVAKHNIDYVKTIPTQYDKSTITPVEQLAPDGTSQTKHTPPRALSDVEKKRAGTDPGFAQYLQQHGFLPEDWQ